MSVWVICSRSCWWPWHVSIAQKRPVSRKFAVFTIGPSTSPSPATPPKALSNLLMSSIWRTPSSYASSSRSVICFAVHSGWSLRRPQSKSFEVSIPMTTASLPWLITRRAWKGFLTIRNQPLPGPPSWASM